MLAAPLPLAGICFLISTRGTPPAVPVPRAVWEGQAEDQGLGESGSPVLPGHWQTLGFCPSSWAWVGRKEDRRGRLRPGSRKRGTELRRLPMLTAGSGRMRLAGSVPPATTSTQDIWTKISPKLRKESATEVGFSGLSGQVRPGDPMVDQSPQRPSSPLGILHAKPCRADDREPRASASPRAADHSPRLQRMPEPRCKGEESWKNPGSGVHARPII